MGKITMKQLQYRNAFQPLNKQHISWFSYSVKSESEKEAKLQILKNKTKNK